MAPRWCIGFADKQVTRPQPRRAAGDRDLRSRTGARSAGAHVGGKRHERDGSCRGKPVRASTPIRWCRPWPKKPCAASARACRASCRTRATLPHAPISLTAPGSRPISAPRSGWSTRSPSACGNGSISITPIPMPSPSPYAIGFNAAAAPEAMERIKRALGVDDAARGLFDLNVRLGLPTGLKGLGHARGGHRQGRRSGRKPSKSPIRGRSRQRTLPKSSAKVFSARRRDSDGACEMRQQGKRHNRALSSRRRCGFNPPASAARNRKKNAEQIPRRHAKPGHAAQGRSSASTCRRSKRLLDFHVRSGAPAISWPHHKGESLNLTIPERKLFAEAAVRVVAGRVPVTIHVSALAVEDTLALARHAQDIGADGILAITPYFWAPTLEAIEAYFVRLCSSIDLPVLSYNSPSYLDGVEITGESDGAADRNAAEFRRREGSELQQRKVSGNLARGARDAAEFRHADRRRVLVAVGAARRRRLVFGRRLDLPEPVQRSVRHLRRRRMGHARASCNSR